MTQFEFYKSFLFVGELLLAEFCFLYKLNRRKAFPLRVSVALIACFLFAYLLPPFTENAFYRSFLFLLIFSFTIAMCKFVFNENLTTLVFCCLAGYTTQHLAYELYNLTLIVMNASSSTGFYGPSDFTSIFPNLFVFIIYLCTYFVAYFVCYWAFAKNIEGGGVKIQEIFILFFAIFISVIDIFLNAFVVYSPVEGAENYRIIIGILNILCCFVSLYLQFEVATRKKIENEFDSMQEIWNLQKKQYQLSKQNIEIINMKCHDLKHQIRKLGTGDVINPDVVRGIENNIGIYDSIVRTGNPALDVVLTEKSLLCNRENINLGCMIDGEKLSFMSQEDVYALFGNIVDNAIEAVMRVKTEKRVIGLRVYTVHNMLVVSESNYYEGDLIFENGLPKTTKGNTYEHGIGLKSIKYICSKYGGDVQIRNENNIFYIELLFFHSEATD